MSRNEKYYVIVFGPSSDARGKDARSLHKQMIAMGLDEEAKEYDSIEKRNMIKLIERREGGPSSLEVTFSTALGFDVQLHDVLYRLVNHRGESVPSFVIPLHRILDVNSKPVSIDLTEQQRKFILAFMGKSLKRSWMDGFFSDSPVGCEVN